VREHKVEQAMLGSSVILVLSALLLVPPAEAQTPTNLTVLFII
jgi:hypothetical protein